MRSILLLGLLVSTSTFACPTLNGTYNCKSSTGATSKLTIGQVLNNGFTTFTVNTDGDTEVVKADGKWKTETINDQDSGMKIVTSILGSCTSTVFTLKNYATFDGEVGVNMVTKFSKNQNQLIQEISGSAMGETLNEKITCE